MAVGESGEQLLQQQTRLLLGEAAAVDDGVEELRREQAVSKRHVRKEREEKGTCRNGTLAMVVVHMIGSQPQGGQKTFGWLLRASWRAMSG